MSLELLSTVLKKDQNGMGYRMYRNMLSDLSVVNQNQMFGVKGFLVQDGAYRSLSSSFMNAWIMNNIPLTRTPWLIWWICWY